MSDTIQRCWSSNNGPWLHKVTSNASGGNYPSRNKLFFVVLIGILLTEGFLFQDIDGDRAEFLVAYIDLVWMFLGQPDEGLTGFHQSRTKLVYGLSEPNTKGSSNRPGKVSAADTIQRRGHALIVFSLVHLQ